MAHADGIAQIAIDEAGVFQNGEGGGRFAVDGNVGEQAALRVWEGARDLMQTGKCDDGIAEAAEAVDEDAFVAARMDGERHANLTFDFIDVVWIVDMIARCMTRQ